MTKNDDFSNRPYTCYINQQGVIPSKEFKKLVPSNFSNNNKKFFYEDQAKTYR